MKNKLLESHTKWPVYSEMNTEVFARRLKHGVVSDVCAMTVAFCLVAWRWETCTPLVPIEKFVFVYRPKYNSLGYLGLRAHGL